MDPKRKALLDRIQHLESAIARSKEYLASGAHARWSAFRPLFSAKMRDDEVLLPHKDWVRNVFLRRMQKALAYAEKALERLDDKAHASTKHHNQRYNP